MEMALRSLGEPPCAARLRPRSCPSAAAGSFSGQTILQYNGFTPRRVISCMVTSSDYPKRKPRKGFVPKTKGPAPKGFAPKPVPESSNEQKTEQVKFVRDLAELVPSNSPASGDIAKGKGLAEMRTIEVDELLVENASEDAGVNDVRQRSSLAAGAIDDGVGIEELAETKDMLSELKQRKIEVEGLLSRVMADRDGPAAAVLEGSNAQEVAEEDGAIDAVMESTEPPLDPQELIQNKVAIDTDYYQRMLEELAAENYAKGSKLFVIPTVVRPNKDIEIFLNRSLSALANEPDVWIKGGFNGWRWNFFNEQLQKTEFTGDWWSCKLHVPAEAYRVDFVFFNGADVYENNDSKDFAITVDGAISEVDFENFLLEEKRKEIERAAAEEAEHKREAEERQRREEEEAAAEADRARAKAEVAETREKFQHVKGKARSSVDGLWYIEPSNFRGGDRVRLYYNRSSRPLIHAPEIWLHGSFNNWIGGLCITEKLVKIEGRDGDWWYADVVIPGSALVIDWVLADGLPGRAGVYDNNGLQDFHAIVPNAMSEDLFWVEEEQRIFRRIQQERQQRGAAAREKAERTARMRAEMKERTLRSFLLSQKHIVYTDPLEVRAGETVSVLYNPANTVLNGKSEIWFRCSFNRWTHRNGPLPPQRMVKAANGTHLKATVNVPLDSYMMDFVFSDSEGGGLFDNKNGMDYHVHVTGGIAKAPPMHIVHIAVEMAPIAKVGGLGDVVTSLSRAVRELGHNVEVIFPKYDCIDIRYVSDLHYTRSFSHNGTEVKVWFGKVEGIPVHFLEPQNGLFSVGCVYGRNDDQRFGFFCHAALEFLLQTGSQPDILHCHDWSSAPVAWLHKEHYKQYGLANSRVIFTIHNLEFGIHHIGKAMATADRATTVSRTYSREVAGHSAIAPHLYKFYGIINGIDPDIWDPFNDKFIPVHYTSENVLEGKKAAKEALQQKLGLQRADCPIVGVISRLTHQKGIGLIKHALWRTLERGGQFVLLGSAPDSRIQHDFVNLANQLQNSHNNQTRLCLYYDEPLSHMIYAGADFILVPSIFEPCGLTQLIAMRYGSIPVVRKTGGLYDTVFDVDNDKERAKEQALEPNGFSFEGADPAGVDYALNRAITAYYDTRDRLNVLAKTVMEQDWSWSRPALEYMELYYSARK